MSDTAQSSESGTPDVPIPHEGNGGPASAEQLRDLAANGIGSKATPPPESRPENPPETVDYEGSREEPPKTDKSSEIGGPGGGPAEQVEKIRRSSSRGKTEVPLPPTGTEQPKPRAARGPRRGSPPAEAVRETPGTEKLPPTEETPPAPETPQGETPEGQNIRTGEATWRNKDSDQPVNVIGYLGEKDGRVYVKVEGSDTGVPLDEVQYPAETAGPTPSVEAAAPEPAPTPAPAPTQEEATTPPAPQPEVSEPPRQENKLEEQVKERYDALTIGSELKYSNDPKKVPGKVTGFGERPYPDGTKIKTISVQLPDRIHEFPEWEIKEIISDNIREEQQAAQGAAKDASKADREKQMAAERAARESDRLEREQKFAAERVEREKQRAEERAANEAAKAAKAHEEEERRKAFEKEKTKRSESFDRRLQKRLETLQKATAGTELQRGKQTLKFLNYDEFLSNPYKFEDKTGQTFYLTQAEVKKLLAEKVRVEDKTALEQLKQTHGKEKPAADAKEEAKKPEKPTPKWKERLAFAGALTEKAGAAIKKGAEVTPVTRILYDITNRTLNKFDYRDKEKYWYIAGIAAGAGTNVGLVFVPFLQFGPGRVVRSAVFSGGLIAASYTSNRFRNSAVERILKDFGVDNSTDRKSFARQLDETFRLLRSNREEDYHYNMKEISKRIFLKYGKAEHKLDIESQVSVEARNALISKVEALNLKYQKLNSRIRSFSAGLTVGTLGSSLGFGLWPKVQSLFERIHGGGHVVPAPGIEHGAPTHAPPVEGQTATPTPTPEVPHGAIPTVPPIVEPAHIPAISEIISNPELAHSVGIHSGDTVGQIFVNNGQPLTWGPGNADLFGTHILANYDMLHTMHDNVVAAGLATSDFPTQEAVVGLIKAADAGDAASFQDLVNAAHWIPVGDNWNELTDFGQEAVKKSFGIP